LNTDCAHLTFPLAYIIYPTDTPTSTKNKTKSRSKTSKRVVDLRDVYQKYEFEGKSTFKQSELNVKVEDISLPSFADFTMEDVRDFEKRQGVCKGLRRCLQPSP
jgi:hypothetical protein